MTLFICVPPGDRRNEAPRRIRRRAISSDIFIRKAIVHETFPLKKIQDTECEMSVY